MTDTSNARALALGLALGEGIKLTEAGGTAVTAKLHDALRYDADGKPYLSTATGDRMMTADASGRAVELTFGQFVAEAAKSDAAFTVADETAKQPLPADATLTQRMLAQREAERKASPAGQLAAAAVQGNPWLPGSLNLTQQMLLTRHDPARAQRLKALAGAAS